MTQITDTQNLNKIEPLLKLHRTKTVRFEMYILITQVRSISGRGTVQTYREVSVRARQKPNRKEEYRIRVGIWWPRSGRVVSCVKEPRTSGMGSEGRSTGVAGVIIILTNCV
jgi:hypothetical protein